MIATREIVNLSDEAFEAAGFDWYDNDDGRYCVPELVGITEMEAGAFYALTPKLMDMAVVAGDHVIRNDLFAQLGIHPNLVPLIKRTWEDERERLLYFRADIAGGIDGIQPKLIELNMDTATTLFEAAIIQWLQLRENNIDEDSQHNDIFEYLVQNLREVAELNFDKKRRLLVSALPECSEDETTCRLIGMAAEEAGFIWEYCPVDEVVFDGTGIFTKADESGATVHQWDFWFKLIPWERIAEDEPEMLARLAEIIDKRAAIIINPPYAVMLQSKGLLKIMWDLFPNHPLLLDTSLYPLGGDYVKKVILGREGCNISIFKQDTLTHSTEGDYGDQQVIYQRLAEFPRDNQGNYYQSGVFYVGDGAGVAFRRGGPVIDNYSQFVGHYIVDHQKDLL